MTENPSPKQDFSEAFNSLGKNIRELLSSVWNSQQKQEIQKNIDDMAATLNHAASDFSQSQTGQQLKKDLEDLRQRVENGELETQLRNDVLEAVQILNEKIEQARQYFNVHDENK